MSLFGVFYFFIKESIMKTVAVFFGGRSSEREISVITGVYAVNLLRGADLRVLPVFLSAENEMFLCEDAYEIEDFRIEDEILDKRKFLPVRLARGGLCFEKKPKKRIPLDCALNCCHGGLGEGGALSALLEWHEIVSASPRMPESALFLDKALTKIALKGLDVPVVPFIVLREKDQGGADEMIQNAFGYPVIVKPSKLGSSVGISVAKNAGELKCALELSFKLDSVALIEKYISGKRDLNCAAYRDGNKTVLSSIEEVFSGEPILSFGEKYEGTGARTSQNPAEIPEETAQKIKEILRSVYEAFDMQGIVRADFLLCEEEIYFNELNTVPGTLATYLFGESLLAAKKLLLSLIEDAVRRGIPQKETVKSGILMRHSYGAKSSKRR